MGWSPQINVAEHIIRACEVRIALVANQPLDAARLLQHHIHQYGCRHLPEIVDAMDDYEQNRDRFRERRCRRRREGGTRMAPPSYPDVDSTARVGMSPAAASN